MYPDRNTLYYGDNLSILRQYIPDESVDLVYLDPPFNSNRNYNIFFADGGGHNTDAQNRAFVDTWYWGETAESAYCHLTMRTNPQIATVISAFRQFLGTSQMMAYLAMMAVRLVELHRVMKSTGSLYLHCDPKASHYLKILLDIIFGPQNCRNEVIWKRTSGHNGASRWGPIHDTLLFYTKSEHYCWNKCFESYDPGYVKTFYKREDEGGRYRLSDLTGAGVRRGDSGLPWRGIDPTLIGRHWATPSSISHSVFKSLETEKLSTQEKLDLLDEAGYIYWPPKGKVPQFKRYLSSEKGVPIQDIISDIPPLGAGAAERLGYPTQKPVALLERVIRASSNEGDVVLDPFCGCGTTIAAANNLKRRWIGIDITHLSIMLQRKRLFDSSSLVSNRDYDVIGQPADMGAAYQLAQENRYQFQWWAITLVEAWNHNADPKNRQGKKGADKGIDGEIHFFDDASLKVKRVIVQVKSGKVSSRDIRDLRGVLDRECAPLGVFITLEPPSAPMCAEAASMGFYHSPGWQRDFPRLQIMTIEDLLDGRKPELPNNVTFARAPKERTKSEQQQPKLFMFQDSQ